MRCCHKKTEDKRGVDEAGRSEHPSAPWAASLNARSMDLSELTPVLFATSSGISCQCLKLAWWGYLHHRNGQTLQVSAVLFLSFRRWLLDTHSQTMALYVSLWYKRPEPSTATAVTPERGWVSWVRVNSRTTKNKLKSSVPGLLKPEVDQGHRAVKLVEDQALTPGEEKGYEKSGGWRGFD